MVPLQQVQEEVVQNGLLLKDLYIYDLPDATNGYKQQRTEVKIVAGNSFPFVVKDRFGIFLYHIQWKSNDNDSTIYSVIKNRMFMGDTTFVLNKREMPAIFFKVKEKIEMENEGVTGQLFEGMEIYAKGIGLVYYEKKVSKEAIMAYRFVRGMKMEELEKKTQNLGAVIEYFEPPAVPGYGASSGFAVRLLDKSSDVDYQRLDEVNKDFLAALKKRKELTGLFTFFSANYPQYEIKVNNLLAMQKGVSVGAAMENLNIMIGSTYEQGFVRFNNYYKVYTQADPAFRKDPADILNMFVKNDKGEMVPYSAFMTITKTQGPNEIERYNLYTSALTNGVPAPGYTSGDAIKTIREVAEATLPKGYDIAWEGLSYDEARRGNEAIIIFIVVLFFVYLVLAAQYESFIMPLAVILSLPPGIFGSFLMLKGMGLSNDVFAQIGLIMLTGLLGKNAVLIVEFAIQKRNEGLTVLEAAIAGAKARFRPILMTSFAFIAGLIPLVRAHGAGAVGNKTIGSSAMGGMLFGTIFGVLIVPGLYYVFGTMIDGRKLINDESVVPLTEGLVGQESEVDVSKLKRLISKFLKKNGK
jgi:HAE1 family hydrophobic/amphiphilic exporter-1